MKDDMLKYILLKMCQHIRGTEYMQVAHVYVNEKCKIRKKEYTQFGGNENFNKPITRFLDDVGLNNIYKKC